MGPQFVHRFSVTMYDTQARQFFGNTYLLGGKYQGNVETAVANDGSFVVIWQSVDQDGDSSGIFAQRYDSAGNALGK